MPFPLRTGPAQGRRSAPSGVAPVFAGEIDELDEKTRIRILGWRDCPAPKDAVCRAMTAATGLNLNIALNYGGRQELLRAARSLMADAATGRFDPGELDEQGFARRLYTGGQPEVDLFIRTGGEVRTSNFLPWQTTYAEMVFNEILWPDYSREAFREDLWIYAGRDRRFGMVST